MKLYFSQDFHSKAKTFVIVVTIALLTSCSTTKAAEVNGNQGKTSSSTVKKTEEVVFAEKLQDSFKSDSLDESLALFETMPEDMRNKPDMQVLEASLLISSKRLDEANAIIEKITADDPSNIDAMELSLEVAIVKGDTKARSEIIKKLIELDPANSEANIELASDAMGKNQYRVAQQYYNVVLSDNPSDVNALFGMGVASYCLSKDDDSKKAFEKILEINPENSLALLYLGKLSIEQDRFRTALKYLQEAEKYDKTNYEIYITLGSCYRQLMDMDAAENAWTKAISLSPDFFLGYVYRASLYDETNQFEKAYADYKKVIETNPKYYYAYESLGLLAWHEKDYEGSLQAFQKALSMDAGNISYVLMIAANYKKLGKTNEFKTFLAQQMKPLARTSLEYTITRLYHDGGGINAENAALLQVKREESSSKRGKFLYYMGLFYDLQGKPQLAGELYGNVLAMNSPLFFEYRLAEWSMQ